jgi:hypothetical protein
MNAALYGRQVLTGKRYVRAWHYAMDKRRWFAYLEWEKSQELARLPKTPSKVLDVA